MTRPRSSPAENGSIKGVTGLTAFLIGPAEQMFSPGRVQPRCRHEYLLVDDVYACHVDVVAHPPNVARVQHG